MDFRVLLHQIGQLYQNLSIRQRIVAAGSIVVVVGFLVFLSIYKSSTSSTNFDGYSILFKNISPADSAIIIQQLNKDGVSYKLADEGTILVPTDSVYKERIAVASLGVLKDGKVGFEIFDKQEFGSTDNEQRVKFQRALEGELARTIESLAPISKASVHIAIPKDSVFTERQRPTTASVVLNIKNGQKLNSRQIVGIKNIISASVANLSTDNVKIVNQDGVALGEDGGDFENELIAQQIRYTKDYEEAYEQKIIDLIGKFIGGNDKVTAKVTIDFDFSAKNTQSEVYDPNSVVRSEQNIDERREGKRPAEVGGVPGAVSNIGPVQGLDGNKPDELYTKSVANTNYEISKKVTTIKDQFATIKRITAAVVVDGNYEFKKDEAGIQTNELIYVQRSQDEMNRIKTLIETAIGYDANRGDEVSVNNFEFKTPIEYQLPASKFKSAIDAYFMPFMPFIKYLIVIALIIVLYKKVITPFMRKMLEDIKDEEEVLEVPEFDPDEETEDTLEKFKAARKRVEEQLGIGEDFNEDELKYEVLLEKMKLLATERSEEIASLLQNMVKSDNEFNSRRDI